MSLINKMLQDLEARQESSGAPSVPVYGDLRPVGAGTRRSSWRLAAVLASVLGLGAAIYIAADRWNIELLPANVAAMVVTKTAAPTVVAPKQTASAPVTAIPASAAAAPIEEEEPSAAETAESPPTSVAANQPMPAHTPPPTVATAPAPVQPRAVDSQKNSQVRIVKSSEPAAPAVKNEPVPVAKAPPPARRAPTGTPAAEQVAVMEKKVRPLTAGEKSEAIYRRAARFLDQGRPEDAMDQLRELLRVQPGHVSGRELAAGLALQSGHRREAQELLEEGVRQVPSHYPFARLLARVYVDHGSEAKALAVMESAVPAGSDDPDFSSLLGVLYQRAGRHADAVQVYKRTLALRPQDARSWLGFAISLEGTEQWDAAKRAYARAKESGELTPTLAQYAEQRLEALKNK